MTMISIKAPATRNNRLREVLDWLRQARAALNVPQTTPHQSAPDDLVPPPRSIEIERMIDRDRNWVIRNSLDPRL